MSANSAIQWTDHTFNPWWGCTKVSPGCANCYAETMANRFRVGWGPKATRRPASESYWGLPRKWNAAAKRAGQRARVFCASMADVFDPAAPEHALSRLFDIIRFTPWLEWQLLTKRPENIRASLPADWGNGYRNVLLGTTAENQNMLEKRAPILLQTPARGRFLSLEPLLGAIDLRRVLWVGEEGGAEYSYTPRNMIDWVIVGGESGPRARPMHPDWARILRNQCQTVAVPFFFKQWGEWVGSDHSVANNWPTEHSEMVSAGRVHEWPYMKPPGAPFFGMNFSLKVGKTAAGRLLDGREWNEFPKSKEVENGQG